MIKKLFIVLMLLAILHPASPASDEISAKDAENYVSGEYFLDEGEAVAVYPQVQIQSSSEKYWVVSITSGNALVDFVPLTSTTPTTVVELEITQRNLFKTAYFLREFTKIENTYSLDSDAWIFTSFNAKFMQDLSNDLSTEKVDLSSVKTELSSKPSLESSVDLLSSKLSSMGAAATSISSKISDAIDKKNSFLAEPDVNVLNDLRADMDEIFSDLKSFDEGRQQYMADLSELQLEISKLTALPLQTRKALTTISAPPIRLARISTLATNSAELQQQITDIYNDAVSKADVFAGNLETRMKKNNVYKKIYAVDKDLSTKTDFTTLYQAAETILSENNRSLWADEEAVVKLETGWNTLKAYLRDKQYDLADSSVKTVRDYVISIYTGGYKQDDDKTDTTWLFYAIAGLIGLVIVIYIIRNRGKFLSLMRVGEGEDGEEVKINSYKKF